MQTELKRLETRLVHAGVHKQESHGAAVTPIARSTVYEAREVVDYHDVVYPRLSNLPNQNEAATAIASIEGGEAGLVTASGMAAITTVLISLLESGGHLLAQRPLYGATQHFAYTELPKLGARTSFIDVRDPGSWSEALTADTRAIYVESISNPVLEVADHRRIARFAEQHGLLAIIDNTFATPVNFRPLEVGFDVVVHSATKYLNGHSDVCAGAIVSSKDRIRTIKHWLDILGGSADPEACFLLRRGLKTLALRVGRQNDNALALARVLENHPAVERVLYPGLESHPDHGTAASHFAGYGGMIACVLRGGFEAAQRLTRKVKLVTHSASLGGPETLVTIPAQTSHAGLTAEERRSAGISDGLVRISAGIEHIDDLCCDFDQALA